MVNFFITYISIHSNEKIFWNILVLEKPGSPSFRVQFGNLQPLDRTTEGIAKCIHSKKKKKGRNTRPTKLLGKIEKLKLYYMKRRERYIWHNIY